MSLLILVVDDEPDVEMLFRQQFRRDLREGRFRMEFVQEMTRSIRGGRAPRDSETILTTEVRS